MLLPEAQQVLVECSRLLTDAGFPRHAVLIRAIFEDLTHSIPETERTGVLAREFAPYASRQFAKQPGPPPTPKDEFLEAVSRVARPARPQARAD